MGEQRAAGQLNHMEVGNPSMIYVDRSLPSPTIVAQLRQPLGAGEGALERVQHALARSKQRAPAIGEQHDGDRHATKCRVLLGWCAVHASARARASGQPLPLGQASGVRRVPRQTGYHLHAAHMGLLVPGASSLISRRLMNGWDEQDVAGMTAEQLT